MKVVLFGINWWNPKQALIGLATLSKYCHAGLLFYKQSILYDASESRGNVDFDKEIHLYGNRKILVYDIRDDSKFAEGYAMAKRYTKYDWKGIMGWAPFLGKLNDRRTVYCFELVLQTLLQLKTINHLSVDIIAKDLNKKLYKERIDSDDILLLMERAALNPIYEGKAKDYSFVF